MIAAVPVLFCTLSSDCGFRSNKLSSDQGEALFPVVEALKIPAVWMLGESIIHLMCIHAYGHTLSPGNSSSKTSSHLVRFITITFDPN